jgi:DNA-binding CsgD family transcriptional regulator
LIIPYKSGVRLAKPHQLDPTTTPYSLSNIYQLPLNAYFYNLRTQLVSANDSSIKTLGIDSLHDVVGKTLSHFISRQLSTQVHHNNEQVIRSKKLCIMDEGGQRFDGHHIQALSFKFPWYFKEDIIGIFGCSVESSAACQGELSTKLIAFLSTGLLNNSTLPRGGHEQNIEPSTSLTLREQEVVYQLTRGKTAKGIAITLGISYRTVEHHISNIKRKTGCLSKGELIDQYIDKWVKS